MELSDRRIPIATRQRCLELVAHVLLADFQFTVAEDAFFVRLVSRLGLNEAERREVIERVDLGAPAQMLMADIPPALRTPLQRVIAEAAATDGEVAPRELDLLERVAVVVRILEAQPGLEIEPVEDD